ncbi:MAG: histidinol-phosphate transaminase [Actinomycetota bacterium]
MSNGTAGVVRPAVSQLPAYRPGKGAAQAEAEHGITDAIKLASNENPYPPIPPVIDAIAEAAAGVNRYSDHRAVELREAIADWHGVATDQVTVGCGSVGLIQQLFLTYVDPGDEVVTPWRSFEVYPIDTMLMGADLVGVPLVDGAFDLDAVADAVTERTKLVLVATPNNPTGPAVSTADLRTLLERIPASVIVLVDEAYREFVDPSFGDPVHDLLPDFPNMVVSRSMSKAYGLAGLRVGYLVGHPDVVVEIDKTLLPFAVNLVAQAGALAAVRHRAEYQPAIELIIRERERVVEALREAGWPLYPTQANFVYLDLGERTDEVYLELERRGVVTRPFSGEGVRITIGTPEENDRFLAALAAITS